MELKHVISGLVVAFASYVVVEWMRPKGSVQEPAKLQPRVPVFGHVIGFLQHGLLYIGSTGSVHSKELPGKTLT